MKNDFEFFNPTQVFFGRSAMENLSSVLSLYGDRVLLAYGSDSIRRNGVYDQVMNTLQACGKSSGGRAPGQGQPSRPDSRRGRWLCD